MTPAEIVKLINLAEYSKSQDLAKLAKGKQMYLTICESLDKIQLDKHKNGLAIGDDFAAISRWQNWATVECDRLHSAAGEVQIENETLRNTAAKSAAKVEVLNMFLQQAKADLLQTNRRRAEQNGVPPNA